MKKKILAFTVVAALALGFAGCGNKDVFDTVRTYDEAIISIPDGTCITIDIKQWKDYEDGEQIQIIANDGTVYLVNSVNCVLIRNKKTLN